MDLLVSPQYKFMRKGLAIAMLIALNFWIAACGTTSTTTVPAPIYQETETIISTLQAPLTPTLSTQLVKNDNACWSMKNIGHRSLAGSLLFSYLVMNPATGSPMAGAPAAFDLATGYPKGLKEFLPRNIAPNGKLLTEIREAKWVFLTEKGEVSYPIPDVTLTEGSTYQILSDQQMLWAGPSQNPQNSQNNEIAQDLYTFLPDTGQLNFLHSVSLPNSLWNPSEPQNDYMTGLYSPDIKYVLYPANYQGVKMSILLDIQNQKVVWYGWPGSDLGFYRPPVPYYTIEAPIWRPDSSGVILHQIDEKTGMHNLYNLSTDGSVAQLTHLEELFLESKYIISSLSISPNGQYIAFAAAQDAQAFPGRNSWLLILDLKNQTIINPCVTLANSPSLPARPVWSPDSSAVAIFPDTGNSIVTVDLTEKVIFSLLPKTGLDPSSLVGWIDWEVP